MGIEMTVRYKFKIENVTFVVDIDNSYSNIINYECDDNYLFSMLYQHSHLGYELFFVDEQPLTFFVDDKITQYTNCALCVPPQFSHLTFRRGGYKFFFNIGKKPEKKTDGFEKFIYDIFTNEQPFQLKTDAQLYSYVKELKEILFLKQSVSSEMVICILKLIFCRLYMLNGQKQETKSLIDTKSHLIEIEEMINNLDNDLSMQTIADNLCLSFRQASRTIHKYYNKSLSELLLERKLNAACRLLKYTDSTVAQIVEHIDFSSESYFYSQFRKKYGCTPGEYKKQERCAK